MASNKYPGKYAIVPEVIRFCLSSELFKELDNIMADTAKEAGMGDKDEKEFKLMYTDKYQSFVTNFEHRLETFILDRKCTVAEFYSLCAKAQEMGDDSIDTFVTILSQMTEFQSFVDMCRDKQKRAYVQNMLVQYAKMITQ